MNSNTFIVERDWDYMFVPVDRLSHVTLGSFQGYPYPTTCTPKIPVPALRVWVFSGTGTGTRRVIGSGRLGQNTCVNSGVGQETHCKVSAQRSLGSRRCPACDSQHSE